MFIIFNCKNKFNLWKIIEKYILKKDFTFLIFKLKKNAVSTFFKIITFFTISLINENSLGKIFKKLRESHS
jgi:hypothetical protein